MIGNRTMLRKADLALSNLTTDGGILVPAQAKYFIRTLIDKSVVMPLATVVPMRSPLQRLEKIKFGTRVLRAGAEGQALSLSDRAKPDLSRQELSARLFKAEIRLNNEVLEDSIERQQLRSTVMAILAERIALDMDEVVVNGDTSNATDNFLASFDGIIKQASAHQVSNNRNPISKSLLRNMLKAMPTPFLRNKRKLRFFMPVDTEIEYRDSLASRETPGGDAYLGEDVPVAYQGVPLIDVPVFPEKLGGSTDQQDVLLTDPKNVNVGIWRQITMETDKDISAGVLVIVATLRFDTKYVEPDATVLATDLIHAS
jgi:hypothetical protein